MGNSVDFVKTICKERKIPISRLEKDCGFSNGYIRSLKNGTFPSDRLDVISKYLKIPMSDLINGEAKEVSELQRRCNPNRKYVSVPILAYVAAGIPIEAVTDVLDYEEIPDELARGGEYFGLRIKGDSMEPEIMNGDYIIVRKQEDAENGETVVVLINGNEGTCKKIQKGQNSLVLVSNNREYAPMIYTREEVENLPVRIAGKVVEIRRKL